MLTRLARRVLALAGARHLPPTRWTEADEIFINESSDLGLGVLLAR